MGGILAREGHLGMRPHYRELRRISISKPKRTGRRIARDEDRAAQSDYRSPTLCCGWIGLILQ
ncbi:hypothetical protein ABG768_006398 [Culter alburnus]|uniref:Uncharacterized protein n=1 Tax=Culter alburnus TaxID=194366 RepID=A0AAW1ZSS4_CULAL